MTKLEVLDLLDTVKKEIIKSDNESICIVIEDDLLCRVFQNFTMRTTSDRNVISGETRTSLRIRNEQK